MKAERHKAIIDIISSQNIETQDMLVAKLQEQGFNVTQATISRDIKELNLVKIAGSEGISRYAAGAQDNRRTVNPNYGIRSGVSDAVISMDKAGNLVVIKTIPGMAMAVAAMVDAMNISGIVGSIAGDDTIMCAVSSEGMVDSVLNKLGALM